MNLTEVLNKNELNKDDLILLLNLEDKGDIKFLYEKADSIRKQYCGNEVHLRGIIEFSNYCEQNCLYCGLRKNNKSLQRYRMNYEEILNTARTIFKLGVKTIVLQSGEDYYYTKEEIRKIISAIKNEMDVAITLSLGEREFDEYIIWKKAGADRYLLKHETANTEIYSAVHQKQKLQERIEHLIFLKSIGYQTGSGNIIGLPSQTIEDIAEDIILCKELEIDMASISPFIPSPATPYGRHYSADVNLVLRAMAITRIFLKDVHIPATTALATIDKMGREKGLRAGANVIMPNYTPSPYRENYLIYPNKKCLSEDPTNCISCLSIIVGAMGRTISKSKGHSLKSINQKQMAAF